jgi:hypothetical protein
MYGKELTGKQLEQFHVDFNLDGAEDGCDIYAVTSIFLGKKSYIDILECKNRDGTIITGEHLRLKGITSEGLKDASLGYDEGYLGLYKDLAKGNAKTITLNPFSVEDNKQKVLFEFSNGGVRTRSKFTREVSF